MAEFSLQALHDEIEADPKGLGYKETGVWKGDQVIAGLINAKYYWIDQLWGAGTVIFVSQVAYAANL